ncbi:MAG: LCP family protein [Chloroflexota bacterium]
MKRLPAWLTAATLLTSCRGLPARATPTLPAPIAPRSPTATAFRPAIATQLAATPTAPTTRVWPEPFTYGLPTPLPTAIPTAVEPFAFAPDVVNILLAGTDRRNSGGVRTDTLVLLSVQPSAHGAVLISIPRDLYVYLPGLTMQRVNTAYTLGDIHGYPGGGVALLKDTLLYNLGLRVDYVALIDMSGFRSLIDRLGGIDVDVTCPYTDWRLKEPELAPEDEDNWELFTVSPGVVHMDGDYALWYARARARSSDFDRARRQQEVLRALYRQIFRLGLIPQLPGLYSELTSRVTTDIPLDELLDLALLAPWIDLGQVRSRFIGRDQVTGWRVPENGAQVLLPQPQAIRGLLDQTFSFDSADSETPQAFATVEVINASSHPDWAELAAARLNYAGFRAHIGRAQSGSGEPTYLVDYGLADAAERDRLARAIGLRSGAVRQQPDASSPFVFTLVVGDDYSPCFNPTRNQGD